MSVLSGTNSMESQLKFHLECSEKCPINSKIYMYECWEQKLYNQDKYGKFEGILSAQQVYYKVIKKLGGGEEID